MNRFAEAIQQSRVDVVPRVMVGGGQPGSATGGSIMEGLLTMLLSEKLGVNLANQANLPRTPEAEALRSQVYQSIDKKPQEPGNTGTQTAK